MSSSLSDTAAFRLDAEARFSPAGFCAPALMSTAPTWPGIDAALTVFAILLVGFAGWYGWRMWRQHGGGSKNKQPSEASPTEEQPSESIDSSRQPAVDTGPMRQTTSVTDAPVEKAFFSPDDDAGTRHCPDCDRTFPDVFDVCPFDSTPLRHPAGHNFGTGDKRLPRRYCPDCHRRYELSADFCYHDGQKLTRDTDRHSRSAPTFFVCRSCGFETRDKRQRCPHDDELLTRLDPEQRRSIRPAFPYNRCRQCGHVAAPDQTHCPTDGSLLLPAISARLTALAPTGYGARRKICPECGTQFGDQCSFCSHDGAALLVMN